MNPSIIHLACFDLRSMLSYAIAISQGYKIGSHLLLQRCRKSVLSNQIIVNKKRESRAISTERPCQIFSIRCVSDAVDVTKTSLITAIAQGKRADISVLTAK